MKIGSANSEMMLLGCTGPMDSVIIGNILDSMSDSLVVVGEDGEILYVNAITDTILGYSFDDFRKKGLADLFFASEQNREFKQVFLDALWKKSIRNYREVDYHHPDGSVRRLAATTSYLLANGDHASTFIGFVALFKDITEIFALRRLEKALMEEKEKIAREQAASLHKMAMAVAHEIRNPTVTIGGFASRILKKPGKLEEVVRAAQSILDDARRLEVLVNEVQQYCDLPEPLLAAGSMSELMAAVVAELVPMGKERNISLVVHDHLPAGSSVRFDRNLLKKALERLIVNAMEFSQDGSGVDIALSAEDHSTIVEVRDHGKGIKEEDRRYIFKPFYSTQVHGTGMGLAIVERVVREHMGKIEVESQAGKGTAFRVILPSALNPAAPL
jgi:PAS domain S-box-containing protein